MRKVSWHANSHSLERPSSPARQAESVALRHWRSRAQAPPRSWPRALQKGSLESLREIGRINPNVLVVPTDVSVEAQVQDLMDRTVSELGRIDILFNNAGNAYVGPIEAERFVVDLQKMLAVSFYGTVYGTRSVLPIMKRLGAGHIVNMSSVVGRKSFPRFGAYLIAMHAISAFSDALRQELRGNGIAVTTIHPALTQTGLLEGVDPAAMPRPFRAMTPRSPELIAKGIVNAVHKRRSRVVMPFQPHMLLLGDALSPALGDLIVRLLSKPFFTSLIGMYQGRVYQHQAAGR